MPNLPDTSFLSRDPVPLLADYLDYLCAPLIGVLPYERRREVYLEVRLHLESLAEELAEPGHTPEEALTAALQEFGEPWTVGEGMVRTLSPQATDGSARSVRTAMAHGVAWFGLPAAGCLLLLTQHAVDDPRAELLPLLTLLTLVTPAFGGALTGFTSPVRADAGVCRALALVGVISLGVALLLLPSPMGLAFLGVQAAYWVPVGWFAARVAVCIRRQYRRGCFLRPAGRRLSYGSLHEGRKS